VESFGCVDVVDWDQSVRLEALDGTGVLVGKAISVTINCDECETYHGGTDPGSPVKAVSLIR